MVYYPLSYYITILIPIWETKRIGVEPIQIMTVPWSFSAGNLSGPLSTFYIIIDSFSFNLIGFVKLNKLFLDSTPLFLEFLSFCT